MDGSKAMKSRFSKPNPAAKILNFVHDREVKFFRRANASSATHNPQSNS